MGKLKIMGKQKSRSSIPPGGLCFPTVTYTLNNRISISRWFITVTSENSFLLDREIMLVVERIQCTKHHGHYSTESVSLVER